MASIGRASTMLASGTMVSRVLGFAKSWLLIQAIGITGGADAYATSTIVPNSLYAIIAQGILNAILVPQIVRAAAHKDGGRAYINKLVTIGMLVFAVLAVVATLLAPALMHLYGVRGDDKIALATAFAYWSLPQIFFLGLYTLLGEVLNARKSFGPFTWAPVLNNVVGITMLVIFIAAFGSDANSTRPVDSWTPGMIALLAGGATLGVALQAIVLFAFWRHVGLRFRPDFSWRGVNLGVAGRAAGWTFAMLLATQFAGLIETNVANSASGEYASTQAMTTSWLIFMLPHSIIAVSVVTAFYTRMSEHARDGEFARFRGDFSTAVRSIQAIIVFASASLIVTAYPIARFFTPQYEQMGNVLIAYLVGLIPFTALFVIQRAFYALGDTRTPFFFTLAQVAVIIVGVLACFAVPESVRAMSIAFVVSFAGTVQAALAAILLRRRLGRLDGRRILSGVWRFLAAGVVATIVGLIVLIALGGTSGGFAVAGPVSALVAIAAIGIVMLVTYVAALRLLRSPELQDALLFARTRLRR